MKKYYAILFAVTFVFLSACTTTPKKDIKVVAHTDPKVDFGNYKSYGWLDTATIINDDYGQWEPPQFDADKEIKYLIDTKLRKRGMVENSKTPDVFITFAAGVDMDKLGLKKAPGKEIEILKNTPQGGLVTVLVDGKSGAIVWVGMVTSQVQQNLDPKSAKARLNYAVSQMLKELPK